MGNEIDFPQHLIRESREQPPGPFHILLLQRQYFFTVEGEGQPPILLLLHPHLHIFWSNLVRPRAQRELGRGLTAHQNVPVFSHRCRYMTLEIDQGKQSGPAALGAED